MRGTILALVAALAIGAAPSAQAHALLDHASPAVGSAVATSPAAVTLWFTENLKPNSSSILVTDQAGQRADLGGAQIPQGQPAELQVGLKPLAPGTYTVRWHAVSADGDPTDGRFTFDVGGR
jgi:methionine-rich copper-binding protein CopC